MADDSLNAAFAARNEFERARREPPAETRVDAVLNGVQSRVVHHNKSVSAIRPADVVKLARQRLRDVRRELKLTRKRLRLLEREETELSRLLDAADGKNNRPASVRELRRPA